MIMRSWSASSNEIEREVECENFNIQQAAVEATGKRGGTRKKHAPQGRALYMETMITEFELAKSNELNKTVSQRKKSLDCDVEFNR